MQWPETTIKPKQEKNKINECVSAKAPQKTQWPETPIKPKQEKNKIKDCVWAKAEANVQLIRIS